MRRTILTICTIGMLLNASTACALEFEDYEWQEGPNGHLYALTKEFGSWEQCQAEAVAVGGHLATISDATENSFVAGVAKDSYMRNGVIYAGYNLAWIGLLTIDSELKTLEWITGESVEYTYLFEPGLGYFPHWYIHGASHNHWPGSWNSNPVHDTNPSMNPRGVIEIDNPFTIVEGTLDVDPDTLNLASKGKWITCYVTLPEPYAVEDVDPDSILLNELIAPAWSMIDEKEQVLKIKFNRAQIQEMLVPGEAQLMVSGLLTGDILFEAFDTIYVIDPTNTAGSKFSAYDVFEYNGHLYALTLCAGTWEECEAEAQMLGGHLVSINDAAENDWLYYGFLQADQPYVGAVPYTWIGLYQDHTDPSFSEPRGGWKWIGGEPITFMKWAFREPTNSSPREDYATIAGYKPDGEWNDWGPDRPDFVPAHGIIEIGGE